MDREEILQRRADRVQARTEEYVHRAKRMVLDLFGIEAAHDQTQITLQLAIAMVQLEAAELIAINESKIAQTLEKKGS
jgi:hypothetical protein